MATPEELLDRLNRCLDHFKAQRVEDLTDVYAYHPDIRRARLGSGAFGETFVVKSVKDPKEYLRVAKCIPKARISKTALQIQHICAEIAVTTKMYSPFLNHAVGLYHNDSHLYLILEMCDGPTPPLRTRLYHLFARYAPPRIPEVEGIAQGYEKDWASEKERFIEAKGVPSNPEEEEVLAQEEKQFIEAKMVNMLTQLGVKKEAPTKSDLLDYIVYHKKVPEQKAQIILRQCLKGIQFMHDNQVVHRDIKTENVILGETRSAEPITDENGKVTGVRIREKIQAKLIDFGIVKYLRLDTFPTSPSPGTFENATDPFAGDATFDENHNTASGWSTNVVNVTPCGTELYSSLEALTGILNSGAGKSKWSSTSDMLPKLDVYGCGTMLFCMLNGRPPFRLPNQRVKNQLEKLQLIQELIAAGPKFSDTISPAGKAMVLKLMSNDANARPYAYQALEDRYFESTGDTYTYEVSCDGTVSVVADQSTPEEEQEAAQQLREDQVMDAIRGKEDNGDYKNKDASVNEAEGGENATC